MEMRNHQLGLVQLENPKFACICDDDHILEDPDEARRKLERRDYDLVYATKIMFWDDLTKVSSAFPKHRSVLFFRSLPGDHFDPDRIVHAPQMIHTSARTVDLKGGLLDVGYLYSEDRERVWARYKRTGKIDAATLPLIRQPQLVDYQSDSKWYKLLKEHLS